MSDRLCAPHNALSSLRALPRLDCRRHFPRYGHGSSSHHAREEEKCRLMGSTLDMWRSSPRHFVHHPHSLLDLA
jgi:hypothetical protein